jgi:RecJ-like exonuclease
LGTHLLKRAHEIAAIIKQSQTIHIVTHIDADGISAGAIASETLKRLGKIYSIECVKQLDDTVLHRLADENHELVWFTDLGSSISTTYPDIKKIITDHHACPKDANFSFHLNPHLFNLEGSHDISGAGTTFLVSKCIDKKNIDFSPLAIVGAVGDLQDRKYCKLQGTNQEIVADGKTCGLIQATMDIRYFGRETRPISKLLQFSSDPFIPGLSGREDACISFLEDMHIRLKDGDEWRKWIDLTQNERQTIISSIVQMLLNKGFGHKIASRVIGEVYVLCQEKPGSELHDAKQFATLLNSTARYDQYEVGLKVCLGDRGEWLEKAINLLGGHRRNLVEGLQFAREEKITKRQYIQFFHAGDGIRDTIIGIVTNMMLYSENISSDLPLVGFAYTKNGEVKVSARTTQSFVDKGINLSVALNYAAKALNGVGGGHNIAAGATIPKGKEEDFLDLLEQKIKDQLGF